MRESKAWLDLYLNMYCRFQSRSTKSVSRSKKTRSTISTVTWLRYATYNLMKRGTAGTEETCLHRKLTNKLWYEVPIQDKCDKT